MSAIYSERTRRAMEARGDPAPPQSTAVDSGHGFDVERHRRIVRCPSRRKLPEDARGCGCVWACDSGKGTGRNGSVRLADCEACVLDPDSPARLRDCDGTR